MKVAIVSSSYHPYYKGGGEYSVKKLAEGLVHENHEVIVISAYYHYLEENINGVKVYRVKHPNIYWSYDSAKQSSLNKLVWHIKEGFNKNVANTIEPILNKEKPDVLHIRNSEDFTYAPVIAKKLSIPVVVTTNSCTWLCPRGTMHREEKNCIGQCKDCQILTFSKKQVSKKVDAVVGVSKYMTELHQHYNYFPNATRATIYTAAKPTPHELPIDTSHAITLGYIGRIHPIKGVIELIQAFKKISFFEVSLIVAGDGPKDYVDKCKSIASNDNRISFIGKVESQSFYKQVDVVVISSLVNDAFPRVLVEAYSHRRPVVASNTGGTPEMVRNNKTGFLYDPTDESDLIRALNKAASLRKNELLSMQANIAAFTAKEFQNDIKQYISIYKSLLPSVE